VRMLEFINPRVSSKGSVKVEVYRSRWVPNTKTRRKSTRRRWGKRLFS